MHTAAPASVARSRFVALTIALLASCFVSPTLAAPPPDNGWLVWASNRLAARHEIYLLKLGAGGEPVRLTHNGGEMPAWSPDGRWISYHHPGDHTTHVVRPDGSDDHSVCNGFPVFWMHDNSGVVCAVLKTDWVGWEGMSRSDQYLLAHPELGTSTELFKRSDFKQLDDGFGSLGIKHLIPGGITNDGRWLVGWVFGLFELGYTADNGRFQSTHSSVALDLRDKNKLYYLGPGCTTTTPSQGALVYNVSREGGTAPDIYSLDINEIMTRNTYQKVMGRADADWGHDYFPRISTDNRWLTYGASTGCHPWYDCDYEIFLHELGTDSTQSVRLTTNPANDNYPHLFVGEPWKPEPEARIGLAPDRVLLHGTAAAPPPARQVVAWSAGGKPLGPAQAQVSYDSGPKDWLEITTTVTAQGTNFVLTPKTSGLASGQHTARVAIVAAGAVNSPRSFPVQLTYTGSGVALPGATDAGADAVAGDDDTGVPADTDASAAGSDASGDGTAAPAGPDDSSGCGCRVGRPTAPASAVSAGALSFALAALAWAGRRRARRRWRDAL